jgi:glucose-1-phosphate adenylyltransferase
MDMKSVLGLIMGGGRGSRLYPLTKLRAKPAVPLAGKYRLVDIPISNCLHAGIDKIAILTQYNSVSLHRHIQRTYARDMFSEGWVQILAAEQTPSSTGWYQGTADAVRQQLMEIEAARTEYVLVLAGDHLYNMDYRAFVEYHVDTGADVTMAVQPVSADMAPALGILKRRADGRIESFTEKPQPTALAGLESLSDPERPYLASMGIYVFHTDLLCEVLASAGDDFGKDIIPKALADYRVMGHVHDEYWADIGTIRRFYEVNLEMTLAERPFDFYIPGRPIYSHPRFLPATEVYGARIEHALLADGCRVADAQISHAVIGLRSQIGPKTQIRSSILMGADYYENAADRAENKRLGRPDIGIGEGTIIEGAIIDKNARIGRQVHIRLLDERPDSETNNWAARDGLVVVPKDAALADGTVI